MPQVDPLEASRLVDVGPPADKKAEAAKAIGEASGSSEHEFKGRILLQCDKGLPFSVIREVMYTAGQAQFGEFKFVVYKQE